MFFEPQEPAQNRTLKQNMDVPFRQRKPVYVWPQKLTTKTRRLWSWIHTTTTAWIRQEMKTPEATSAETAGVQASATTEVVGVEDGVMTEVADAKTLERLLYLRIAFGRGRRRAALLRRRALRRQCDGGGRMMETERRPRGPPKVVLPIVYKNTQNLSLCACRSDSECALALIF